MPLGFSAGDVVRLAREAREGAPQARPVLVLGPLAPQLTRALAAGADSHAVRTEGRPEQASALVCVLAGEPRAEQLELLRGAARALVPIVAVQTGEPRTRVPYVPAADVIDCPPGRGFPVDEIAATLVRVLGKDVTGVAARLPVLRDAALRRLVAESAGRAAVIAGAPWVRRSHLPLLVLLQARLLRDLATASGRPPPQTPQEVGVALGPELSGTLAVGLAGRALSRSVSWAGAPGRAAIALAGTLALGGLAATAHTRLGSPG